MGQSKNLKVGAHKEVEVAHVEKGGGEELQFSGRLLVAQQLHHGYC